MGRYKAEKTLLAERRRLSVELNIGERLEAEAKEKSKEDPKYFVEYLTMSVYNEMLNDSDKQTRYKAAKDMLAFTLAKKRPQGMGVKQDGDEGKKLFQPNLPTPKPKEPIPENIQLRIHSIKEANTKK